MIGLLCFALAVLASSFKSKLRLEAENAVERLIESIRRECVDHIIVLGEMHLRQILKSYAGYYNDIRTHRSLDKDAPVTRQIQRIGSIKSHAMLGGLHHHYARA
jgi:Integrase core domain